jgi:hypothetical protein
LIRRSDSLFFGPQSDSEKKKKRHSKELREKRPNLLCRSIHYPPKIHNDPDPGSDNGFDNPHGDWLGFG